MKKFLGKKYKELTEEEKEEIENKIMGFCFCEETPNEGIIIYENGVALKGHRYGKRHIVEDMEAIFHSSKEYGSEKYKID